MMTYAAKECVKDARGQGDLIQGPHFGLTNNHQKIGEERGGRGARLGIYSGLVSYSYECHGRIHAYGRQSDTTQKFQDILNVKGN